MVYSYENKAIPLQQVSYYVKIGDFPKFEIDFPVTQELLDHKPVGDESKINVLLEKVQPGDVVITSTLVNFSRAYGNMLSILKRFLLKEVRVISIMEKFDSEECLPKSLLDQMQWLELYDVNRNAVFRTNQNAGIQRARKEGKYTNSLLGKDIDKLMNYAELISNNQITKLKAAEELGVSRPTLDKLLKQLEEIAQNGK